MHIHILGICGTFMGSLALLAREMGHQVTGADEHVYPPMSTQLQAAGIVLHEGYDAEHLSFMNNVDVVVIGNALSRGNAAVEYVLNNSLAYQSGPQWLAQEVLKGRWVLAVAGTHGKTTTASMLAWILECAGLEPGYLIGGVPENFGHSAQLGKGKYFVIEADEYDSAFFDKRSKFIHYCPRTLLLNNLEFDHADIFADLPAIQRQFHHLIRTVPSNGRIFLPVDTNLREVLDMGCWTDIEFLSGGSSPWQLNSSSADQSEFSVSRQVVNSDLESSDVDKKLRAKVDNKLKAKVDNKLKVKVDRKLKATEGLVKWDLYGLHNQDNALGAIAAAYHVGVDVNVSATALSQFKSVKRRMELVSKTKDVSVYDDFAHHPTAIKTSLAGMRAKFPNGRILAVIESRSNTMRMGVLNKDLPSAIQDADRVWWYEGKDKAGDDRDGLASVFVDSAKVTLINSVDAIVQQVVAVAQAGDQIVIMSNGGFSGIHGLISTALSKKFPDAKVAY